MKYTYLAFFLGLLSIPASGSDSAEVFRLTAARGEAVLVFRWEKAGQKNLLSLEKDGHQIAVRTLLPDDQSYLRAKLDAVPAAQEAGCLRESFRLSDYPEPGREITACANGNTAASRALAALTGLLAGFL